MSRMNCSHYVLNKRLVCKRNARFQAAPANTFIRSQQIEKSHVLHDARILAREPVIVGGIIPPQDAMMLKQMGVRRVYTPKDFKITPMMGDVARTALAAVEARLSPEA